MATTPTHYLDMQSGFDPPQAGYAGISLPTLVVRGERTHRPRQGARKSCATRYPALVTVADAGHFMIATHPGEVAKLLHLPYARHEHLGRTSPKADMDDPRVHDRGTSIGRPISNQRSIMVPVPGVLWLKPDGWQVDTTQHETDERFLPRRSCLGKDVRQMGFQRRHRYAQPGGYASHVGSVDNRR